MKKWTTRALRKLKHNGAAAKDTISMLTCYDFQTAQMLNESDLDLILVGDSLGNVILGYENTVSVTVNDMITFGSAVKRGAPDKFTVVDMPFGSYATETMAIKNALKIFQDTKCEALKLEGASTDILSSIKKLTIAGIPVMGHIGLTPQSVHQLGGYYTHGKTNQEAIKLIEQAKELEKAGAFSIVLECVTSEIAKEIDKSVSIPTIGIGSGKDTTGQVLVLNDLLGLGKKPAPSFCSPVSALYETKLKLTNEYIKSTKLSRSTEIDH